MSPTGRITGTVGTSALDAGRTTALVLFVLALVMLVALVVVVLVLVTFEAALPFPLVATGVGSISVEGSQSSVAWWDMCPIDCCFPYCLSFVGFCANGSACLCKWKRLP